MAGARPGPSLGLAHGGRAAAVRADGRGLRRLPEPRRPRARPAPGPPRAHRRARQHDHRARLRQRSSGEGGPNGSVNENKFFNGVPDTMEENLKYLDVLGSPLTYNHYPTGWAWAFNTPFKLWKRYANFEGGTADPLIVSWPRGHRGEAVRSGASTATRSTSSRRCSTALDIEMTGRRQRLHQHPLEGVSFTSDLRRRRGDDAQGDPVLLDAGHAGDLAQRLEGGDGGPRSARGRGETSTSSAGSCSTPTTDVSECHDLSEQHPVKLQELIALWWAEAGRYGALPLESRGAVEILTTERPAAQQAALALRLPPGRAGVPESVTPNIRNRSYTIGAEIADRDAGGRRGHLLAGLALRRARPLRHRTAG